MASIVFAQIFLILLNLLIFYIILVTFFSGTKGFGGTEGFMAPEIVKYNGEEEYTEKVSQYFSYNKWQNLVFQGRQLLLRHVLVRAALLEGALRRQGERRQGTHPGRTTAGHDLVGRGQVPDLLVGLDGGLLVALAQGASVGQHERVHVLRARVRPPDGRGQPELGGVQRLCHGPTGQVVDDDQLRVRRGAQVALLGGHSPGLEESLRAEDGGRQRGDLHVSGGRGPLAGRQLRLRQRLLGGQDEEGLQLQNGGSRGRLLSSQVCKYFCT